METEVRPVGEFKEVGPRSDREGALRDLPQPRHWIVVPATCALSVLAFGLVVRGLPHFTAAEYQFDKMVAMHRTGFLDWVAFGLNNLFGVPTALWFAAALCLFLITGKKVLNALGLAASLIAGCGSCWVMKLLVDRQTGAGGPFWTNYYPSGHVSFAASLAIACYWAYYQTRWRHLVLVGSLFLVGLVSWSRLYLKVHYPTDVLASWVLTLAAAGFVAGVWNRFIPKLLRIYPQLGQRESGGDRVS